MRICLAAWLASAASCVGFSRELLLTVNRQNHECVLRHLPSRLKNFAFQFTIRDCGSEIRGFVPHSKCRHETPKNNKNSKEITSKLTINIRRGHTFLSSGCLCAFPLGGALPCPLHVTWISVISFVSVLFGRYCCKCWLVSSALRCVALRCFAADVTLLDVNETAEIRIGMDLISGPRIT